jgi:hypothetical protein
VVALRRPAGLPASEEISQYISINRSIAASRIVLPILLFGGIASAEPAAFAPGFAGAGSFAVPGSLGSAPLGWPLVLNPSVASTDTPLLA